MGAGLLQLSIIGEQDKYLTNNPQMTYFKSVYKKHSNFAKETKKVQFVNAPKFGSEHICNIPQEADLLGELYVYVELSNLVSSNNNENWAGYISGLGASIIESATFYIGGQEIDTFDSQWLDIYNELFDQRNDNLIGKFNTDITLQENNMGQKLYIPLPFWFTKNNGNALPIVALKYHEIKIKIKFRNLNELIKSDISNYSHNQINLTSHILANYIYLDTTEKKMFAKNKLQYLIEQTQTLSELPIVTSTEKTKIPLEFSNPIKSIYWVILNDTNHSQNMKTGNNWLSYTCSDSIYSETFNMAKITISGQDRMIDMEASYYRNVIPYETQTYFPRKYIYTYSFSLYPGQYQPSGSCNYSRINAKDSYLNLTFNPVNTSGGSTTGKIKVYGVNYNILNIEKGVGGLLFSN